MDTNLRPNPADQKSGSGEKIADTVQAAYGLFRPLLGPRACRFHPTCSEYGFQSIKKHGLFKGAFLSAARILRCHPWNPGGYDPVPTNTRETN